MWQVHEAERWMRDHAARSADDSGHITLEYGYRVLTVDDSGTLSEEVVIVQRGTARKR